MATTKWGRRDFLKVVGAAAAVQSSILVSGASSMADPMAAKRKPNIIYILADDLGYAEVGCYGQKKIKTPNIDKLCAEGMKFTDHYSGNPVCAPSRCSFMTGMHTGHTEVRGNKQIGGAEGWKLGATTGGQWNIKEDTVTVVKLMKKAGYTTGAFGKWGLGTYGGTGAPDKQGFDDFYGYICQRQAHTYYPNHLWNNGKIERFPENENGKEVTYSQDKIAEHAREFLKRNKDKPFFLYVPFTIPHVSLQVPEESLKEYRGLWPEIPFPGDGYFPHPTPRAAYAAMVSHMDRDVGSLVKLVKDFGLEEDTLIIFTSDNGPTFNGGSDSKFFESAGPFRGLKCSAYEGGIRIPFIARWKGKIKPGTVSNHISAFWDMMPTFCDIAGTATPKGIDGISILPTLMGQPKKQKEHEYLYWEYVRQQAIRMGDWKAYRKSPDSEMELYNLRTDIAESIDLAEKEPKIAAKMRKLLTDARTESDLFPIKKSSAKKGKATGKLLPKRGVLPKENWKVVSVSSEEDSNGKVARMAIDGDPSTWWHSQFVGKKPAHPHEIVIDLGEEHKLRALRYLARQDVGVNGMVKDFEFLAGDSVKSLKPVLKGAFKKTKDEQEAKFDSVSARYIKLRMLSAQGGEVFGTIAEIGLVGK